MRAIGAGAPPRRGAIPRGGQLDKATDLLLLSSPLLALFIRPSSCRSPSRRPSTGTSNRPPWLPLPLPLPPRRPAKSRPPRCSPTSSTRRARSGPSSTRRPFTSPNPPCRSSSRTRSESTRKATPSFPFCETRIRSIGTIAT